MGIRKVTVGIGKSPEQLNYEEKLRKGQGQGRC